MCTRTFFFKLFSKNLKAPRAVVTSLVSNDIQHAPEIRVYINAINMRQNCPDYILFPEPFKNKSIDRSRCLQALLKMKRELRSRMEREICELQKIIVQNDEEDYFQDLEVQRLRSRVQMASFQYNTSYLH